MLLEIALPMIVSSMPVSSDAIGLIVLASS
jgi:hypothetical protein